MPIRMMFSRPIAPGFRRKNLDGCYVVGQRIVIPEERRIQKEGRVVGMASNIIDALVCLIEAKGEFVSSARLKDVLWPDAISSDADVQSYMSALQGALEGRSKSGTYMERKPERGYRLLVNARVAVAEDLPKYNPSTRRVPDDPFKVEAEGAEYILTYHRNLMTVVENRASAHWGATEMMMDEDWEDYLESMTEKYSPALSTDPAVLKLLEDGYDAFAIRTASRILEEHGDHLSLNRCPRCASIARTPQARQCRHCGHDWHDEHG